MQPNYNKIRYITTQYILLIIVKHQEKVLCGLVVSKVLHLITGSHLCVSSTPTSGSAEDPSQYMTLAVEQDVKPQL